MDIINIEWTAISLELRNYCSIIGHSHSHGNNDNHGHCHG